MNRCSRCGHFKLDHLDKSGHCTITVDRSNFVTEFNKVFCQCLAFEPRRVEE